MQNRTRRRWSKSAAHFGAAAILASTSAMADDTEVFTSQIATTAKPNLLFVLDYSGSMAEDAPGDDDLEKIDVLKAAVRNLMKDNEDKINAGIGSLYNWGPSGVLWPISDLQVDANTIDPSIPAGTKIAREAISDLLDTKEADHSTATVDAIADASRYFKGQAGFPPPVNGQCQVNAVILVSDGEPTVRNNTLEIEAAMGGATVDTCKELDAIFGDTTSDESIAGRCGYEIARNMADTELVPGDPDSTVRTFTVGFDTPGNGDEYLEDIAKGGRGEFFPATSPDSLSEALNAILGELFTTSQSFTPLAVDVDRPNFAHDDRLYYSLFKPTAKTSWSGNLKGYFLGADGLVDVNGADATEVKNGVRIMKVDAQSFWSQTPDGDEVLDGGASAQMTTGSRNLYTYTTGDKPESFDGVSLSAGAIHDLRTSNTAITDAMLGGNGKRDELLDWIQNAPMGDPLHSQPVQVNYGTRQVTYVMTNQGFLHAIDTTLPESPNGTLAGGEEIFAFMPPELLPNIEKHYENDWNLNHTYGLDGSLIRWHDDIDKNGIADPGEKVALVFGMRRGGSHYYAIDVTLPETPKYMWRIDGGVGDFKNLGQTWSRPSLIEVNDNGTKKTVLAFGGGYDADALDGSVVRVELDDDDDKRGNAIFLVDELGKEVLTIDHSVSEDMDFAIPSDLTLIDTDEDELVDRIYVGDLGGQLWRIDMPDISNTPRAEVLADLNETNVADAHRTFFYPPSVALNSSVWGDFLSITIGSGNRTNPLREDSNDYMFMVRDEHVKSELPVNFNPFTKADLHKATDNEIGSDDDKVAADARKELKDGEGWYIKLGAHEKSLSPPMTFEGKILATTFDAGDAATQDPCKARGTNRFYLMDVSTAQPVPAQGTTTLTALTADARSIEVNGDGILTQPVVVFRANTGDAAIIVDNEVVSEFKQSLSRIFWHSR